MDKPETIKLEIELPKDQVHIESAPGQDKDGAAEPKRELAEIRKILEAGQISSPDASSDPNSGLKSLVRLPIQKLPAAKDKSPPNPHQKIIIAAGLALALLGLLLWPLTSFYPALGVAIVGAAIVTTGTFVKV